MLGSVPNGQIACHDDMIRRQCNVREAGIIQEHEMACNVHPNQDQKCSHQVSSIINKYTHMINHA